MTLLEQWNIQERLGSKRRMAAAERSSTKVNRGKKGTRGDGSR